MSKIGRNGMILLTAAFCGIILFWACTANDADMVAPEPLPAPPSNVMPEPVPEPVEEETTPEQEFRALVGGIEKQVRELRELSAEQNEVSYELLSASEFQDYVLGLYGGITEEAVTERERELENATNRLLWVIRAEDTLDGVLSQLYSSAASGIYSDGTVRVLYDETTPISQATILTYVHEYVHYLQDQNYGLPSAHTSPVENTTDANLGYTALIEGDAVYLEELYQMEYRDLLNSYPSENNDNSEQLFALIRDYSILIGMSFYPYLGGRSFVEHVLDVNDGDISVLDEVFMDPPNSTEQISYPEKYISDTGEILEAKDEPVKIDPGLFTEAEGWSITEVEDTLGLFFILVWLTSFFTPEYASSVTEITKNWGGDIIRLQEHNDTGEFGLQWVLAWDDRELGAERFHNLLAMVPEVKNEATQASCQPDNADLVSWNYMGNVLVSQVAEHPEHGEINTVAIGSSCQSALQLLPSS